MIWFYFSLKSHLLTIQMHLVLVMMPFPTTASLLVLGAIPKAWGFPKPLNVHHSLINHTFYKKREQSLIFYSLKITLFSKSVLLLKIWFWCSLNCIKNLNYISKIFKWVFFSVPKLTILTRLIFFVQKGGNPWFFKVQLLSDTNTKVKSI